MFGVQHFQSSWVLPKSHHVLLVLFCRRMFQPQSRRQPLENVKNLLMIRIGCRHDCWCGFVAALHHLLVEGRDRYWHWCPIYGTRDLFSSLRNGLEDARLRNWKH